MPGAEHAKAKYVTACIADRSEGFILDFLNIDNYLGDLRYFLI